jgi:hypothetical protein
MSTANPLDRLQQIGTYRCTVNRLRQRGKHMLLFTGVLLWLYWQHNNGEIADYVFMGVCALEIGAGLLLYAFPSAEGVILEGVLSILFGLAILFRQAVEVANGGNPFWLSLLFGLAFLMGGVRQMKHYGRVREAFEEKPTPEQLAWLDDLVKEIKKADPKTDPDAVAFSTGMPVRGKLLGDTGVFIDHWETEMYVVTRPEVEWTTTGKALFGKSVNGKLRIRDRKFMGSVAPESLANLERWKAADEPPAEAVAEPVNE